MRESQRTGQQQCAAEGGLLILIRTGVMTKDVMSGLRPMTNLAHSRCTSIFYSTSYLAFATGGTQSCIMIIRPST